MPKPRTKSPMPRSCPDASPGPVCGSVVGLFGVEGVLGVVSVGVGVGVAVVSVGVGVGVGVGV